MILYKFCTHIMMACVLPILVINILTDVPIAQITNLPTNVNVEELQNSLSVEPKRMFTRTLTEDSWMSVDVHPSGECVDFDIPEECRSGTMTSLSLLRPWQGDVELDRVHCLVVELEAGEFVRAVVEMGDDLDEWVWFAVEVYAPAYAKPILQTGLNTEASTRLPISWEVGTCGSHYVLLRNLFIWPETATRVSVHVWIERVEPPGLVDARRKALAADPRVGWLQENALPVRSISPDYTDFTDLEPLRGMLDGVRVVLLGEANHNAGTDFLARSRLVKFLHQEMDFEVLAFEAPLYAMDVAWNRIRGGAPVRDALRMGLWGFWSHAEQMQSLVRYIGEQAGGERPLEVAGFDFRPWIDPWTWDTPPMFAEGLSAFLRAQDVRQPLADPASLEYGILEVLSAQRYFETMPEPEEQTAFFRAVDETVAELDASPVEEARFWSEALRGVRCHARDETELVDDTTPECFRCEQMGRHLLWLVNERYPEQKIIVWSATFHAIRDHPGLADSHRTVPAMGKSVWDVLDKESYVIGTASYCGKKNHIVTDQHPLLEFEQLMEAAGFEHALVDLRKAAREGSWLGGSFLARPVMHHTEERRWSDILDALLFVREQEPRRQVDSVTEKEQPLPSEIDDDGDS